MLYNSHIFYFASIQPNTENSKITATPNTGRRAVCEMMYNKIYARRDPLETYPTSLTNGCCPCVYIMFFLRAGTRDNEFDSRPNQEIINKITL